MNRWIWVGLGAVKSLRPGVVVILLAQAGRAFDANAQTDTNLHTFGVSPNNGANPYAGLVQGADGNFYGTTLLGGTHGHGAVFRISPGGGYTNLYSFSGYPNDGENPYGGLVQGSDGNYYGTTYHGGASDHGGVFRVSPGGSYTNLYWFGSSANDGRQPRAGLVQGMDGNFYGTASAGGTSFNGTVFRISPNGSYTNLYSFAGPPNDGRWPYGGLLQGSDGNLYGTTRGGGTADMGTVFRISPGGGYTNLYSFSGYPGDGGWPNAGLVQGGDGNFYGTTTLGGTTNAGTVFRVGPSGGYTNLYTFNGYPGDGASPYGGLVQGSDGNFYGTTLAGGTYNAGTVFRISAGGSYTTIYSFSGYPNDGEDPYGGLVQGGDGSFYGTTYNGGTNNEGAVVKLAVSLTAPANQISGIQLAGTNVIFRIPSVAGETYQLQFSSSLTPTNWINVSGVSVTNSIGALLTLTNFGGGLQPQGFYRLDITP